MASTYHRVDSFKPWSKLAARLIPWHQFVAMASTCCQVDTMASANCCQVLILNWNSGATWMPRVFERVTLYIFYVLLQVPDARVILVGTHADHPGLNRTVLEEIWDLLRRMMVDARDHHRQYFSPCSSPVKDTPPDNTGYNPCYYS